MTLLFRDVETLVCERDICKDTANQYRRSVKCFSQQLSEPAKRKHLKEPIVNKWLRSLDEQMAPETIRGRKAGITAVWNWLAEQGMAKHYNPNRLRSVRLPEHVPVPWTVENVRALLEAAKDVEGNLKCGVSAAEMLTAWIWLGYEAGIRPGDIRRLKVERIGEKTHFTQHKTGKVHSFSLSDHCLSQIRPLLKPGREDLIGLSKSSIRYWELKLFAAAEKYGFKRQKGQALGTLRKTHGTEVCRTFGLDAAARSLGHVSGTLVAKRSYVSPEAIQAPPPPPRLVDDIENDRSPTRHRDH